MRWLIEANSRLGSSHAEKFLPCQDNICHLSKGEWHSICISDGAGSSKCSEISSKFVAERFSQSMLLLADLIGVRGPGSWINDHIIHDVLELRKGLKAHTASSELDDYHCTLVCMLVSKAVAIAIHIGDGAIIAGQCEETPDSVVSLNGTLVASLPENGEHKNETFFITEPHWIKHLRIKVLGKVDWFVMGSDGGIEVLSDRQKLDGSLVADLINYIATERNEGDAVSQLIGSDFAAGKTTDDISLALGWFDTEKISNNFIWNGEMSRSLYLDPASNTRNNQSVLIPSIPTTKLLPNARPETSRLTFTNYLKHKKAAIRFSILMFLLMAFLSLCVFLFLSSHDSDVVSRENFINFGSKNLPENELPYGENKSDCDNRRDSDADSLNTTELNVEPTEKRLGGNDDLPTKVPQETPSLQEEPSVYMFDQLMKLWSFIFGRDISEDPQIDESVPRAVEQIEL